MPLNKTALRLYQAIESFVAENHFGPTFEEMAERSAIKSKSNIKPYLERLRDAGLIGFEERIPRAVWLIRDLTRIVMVPKGGSISAGQPITPLDTPDPELGFLPVPLSQLPDANQAQDLFAFRVDGDSMQDASIQDGDWVILNRQFTPREGDTLAFWLHDEQAMTLKRFIDDNDFVLLQPANPKYATKRKPRDQVEALGKVVHVIRSYDA